jgi:hypothetical protein
VAVLFEVAIGSVYLSFCSLSPTPRLLSKDIREELKDKPITDIYGGEHLLRMFGVYQKCFFLMFSTFYFLTLP